MRRKFARRVGVLVTVTAGLWTATHAAPTPVAADALLENQWHLKDRNVEAGGANVRAAWPMSLGSGVVIGIVDDGLQYAHPDLAPNYLASASWDFNSNDADPQPFSTAGHGTAVAGVAAARGDNTIGVSGVAPQASLAGLRLTSVTPTDSQEAAAFGFQPDVIDILNNSWNPTDNATTLKGPGPLAVAARQSAATTGRNGKGRIFVWSSGNGRLLGDDCNYDGYANNRFAIAVGASTDSGVQMSTSEGCSALMVLAPAGGGSRALTTTDLLGTPGYDGSDYTSGFGASQTGAMSAAAPTVSGAVALMLARNPNLGWRDVQDILRRTAVRILPTDPGWTTGSLPHNERLGFGLLDAEAAVEMAGTWNNLPAEEVLAPATKNVNQAIPDINQVGISDSITISSNESNFIIEHVEVEFNATHPWRGDIQVKLTSPSGVVSALAPIRPSDGGDNFAAWKFGSVRHWGQTAAGVWTLNVADRRFQDTGTWNNWTLKIYGHHAAGSAPAAFSKSSPANGATGVPPSTTLSWGASNGATNYEYCFDNTNDNACSNWIDNNQSTSAAISGLSAGATYYWQVRATNATGVTYAQGSSTSFWSMSTGLPPGAFNLSSPSNNATGLSLSPTLSWTASSGATTYEYCYDTTANGACNSSWFSVGTATSVVLNNLSSNTSYSWLVRSINASGAATYAGGSPTAFWNFTTVGAPGAFSHSSPANGAAGQSLTPALSWTAANGASSYEYCVDTTNDGACSAWTSTGGATSANLSGLTAGTTYYWQVRANNTGGTTYAEGSSSSHWSFATVLVPGPFGHSTPSNGATGQAVNPTISWSASTGAASYEYCYDTTNNNACNASWISAGSATSAALSGLAGGTTYYWQVRAINAVGTTYAEANASAFWSFGTVAAPGAFTHSTPANGASGVALNPTLDWSSSSGATGYEYCIDTTNDSACSNWTSSGANSTASVSGLTAGTTYYWHVRANGTGGSTYAEGAATSFWSFTTLGLPAAFGHTSPGSNASAQPTNPTLTWSPSGGATSYEYCVDTTNDNACSGWTSTGTSTSASLSGLNLSTTYFWQVRATNASGTTYADGGAANYWSFNTLGAPLAFNRLSPSNGAMNQLLNVTIGWAASTGASSYEYCFDTSNDGACANWISAGANTSVNLSNLTAGTPYFWQVRAMNAAGTTYGAGGASNFWGFTTMPSPLAFNMASPLNGSVGQSVNPTLSWSPSPNATSFEYCIDTTNDSGCSNWTSAGTNTSVGINGLTAGTNYFWHVRAVNAVATVYAGGSATSFNNFTTQVNPPAAFGHNSPGNGATGLANIPTLSWSASAGAASYEYCIDTTNDNACSGWITTGTGTSVALSNLSQGAQHFWQVRAINPGGTTYAEGSASSFWTFTTQVALPAAFNRTSPSNGAMNQLLSVTLSWAASTGATSYEYCIDATNDDACSGWTSNGTNTSVNVNNLAVGTLYFWQVRATNAAGTTYGAGGATNFWGFTTMPAPLAFNMASPLNGATGQSQNPTLSWSPSPNTTTFEYCVDTTNDNACSGWTSNGTNTSVGLSGLAAGATHYWHVRAVNAVATVYAGGSATNFNNFTTQPAAPGAFSRTSPTNGATGQLLTVSLTWGPSAGATSYEYCFDLINDGACSNWISTGSNTTANLLSLIPSSLYYWQVRAINAAGTTYSSGGASNFWGFTILSLPNGFTHVSPANGAAGMPTSLTLGWTSSLLSTGYEYCIDTTNDNACTGWTSTGTNLSVAVSGLNPGTTYFWHARSNNLVGTTYADGSASAFWSFTTQVNAPAAFSHSSPANGATGQTNTPTLSWGASTGATSFQYCYDTTNDSACSNWISNGTSTSVGLTGLTAGTVYYWHVRAINAGGTAYADGSAATFWSFTTQVAAPGAFSHTSPANGATGQPNSPTLSWGASTGAASYQYCIDTTNDNACSSWISTGTNTSVALSGLPAGTAHYWHVKAINAGGTTYAEGSATTFWSFTPQVGAPAAFAHASPSNGASAQSTSLTLNWTASAGAASYEYCIDTTNDSACSGWTNNGTSTSAVLSGLTAGTTYFWHAKAINAGGTTYADGSAASFWTFTTQVGAPGAFSFSGPANGQQNVSTSPTLSWTASAGAASYEYCIDTTNNSACDATWISTGSNTSVILNGLTVGTQYFWHVRAVNAAGTTYAGGSATAFRTFTTKAKVRRFVDLDGDGSGDVFTYNPVTGAWTRQVSQQGGGFTTSVGAWDAGWTVVPVNFDADARTDFFLFNAQSGQWFKMVNNGTTFTSQATGTWWSGWQRFVMDLDGDGITDMFLYDQSTGQWFKALSTPTGFTYVQGGWNPGWDIYPMSLNEDALDDMFLINRTTGRWFWVTSEANGGFSYPASEAWFPGWTLHPGDFNGDGKTDLLLHDPATGVYFVATATESGYSYKQGGWSLGWSPTSADFNGDGADDLFLHDPATGVWFEMVSDAAGNFTNSGGQTWSLGWELHPTDLNADGRTDLVLYHPATGVWYEARNMVLGSFTYSSGSWESGLEIIVRPPIR